MAPTFINMFNALCLFTCITTDVLCELIEATFEKDGSFSDRMCSSSEVVFQAEARSAIFCVNMCAAESAVCVSAIFHGQTCYGIKSVGPFISSSSLPGARFYKKTAPTTTTTTTTTPTTTVLGCGSNNALVAGVSNSQLSASDHHGSYSASYARLDENWNWSSGTGNPSDWIQVDFLSIKVVTMITTQGSRYDNEWVTTYKLFTSTDCGTFFVVRNNAGSPQVFSGNTDRSNKVTNAIAPALTVRCVRISPQSYSGWPSLRFDIYECNS